MLACESDEALIQIKFVCPLPTDPKLSRRLKTFYWKKVLFLSVTTVQRITFYSISTETITEKLEINVISRHIFCVLVSLVLEL